MARTAIVRISDYAIRLTYAGTPKTGSDLVKSFGGPYIDSNTHEHVQYDEGTLTDDSVLKAQDNSGTEIVEDATKVAARKAGKWIAHRVERDLKISKTDMTMMSDAPAGWSDWTTYRQELRDYPQDNATKFVDLVSASGQDDVKIRGNGGCTCDINVEVVDPAAADQALAVTVTGEDIKVDLATDSGSVITTTNQQLIDEINNDVDAGALVTASLKGGATGTDVIDTAIAKMPLTTEAELDSLTWPTPPADPVIDNL